MSENQHSLCPPRSRRPRAILFDMDGTITEPMLDFPKIKAAMGIGARPILEALAEMDGRRRLEAEAVLHEHEDQAARQSKLNAGCDDLIAWIRSSRLRTALITRNSRRSAAHVLQKHGLSFDVLITREDARFKPDPQPLRIACERLGVGPDEAVTVQSLQAGVGAAAGFFRPIEVAGTGHDATRERFAPDSP